MKGLSSKHLVVRETNAGRKDNIRVLKDKTIPQKSGDSYSSPYHLKKKKGNKNVPHFSGVCYAGRRKPARFKLVP